MNAIGSPVPRVEGRAKVTGGARYAAEFHPDGLVYAATADSTVAAGRITAIYTRAAEQAPGVLAVLTHLNTPRLPYVAAQERAAVDPVSGDQLRVLDGPEVRFNGQPVAVVVARTQAEAEHGAALVDVAYDRDVNAKTRFDPVLAQPTSAAAAKAGRGPETRRGDPDGAFTAAPVSLDRSYSQPREQHNAMEPHATVAEWQGSRLTLWSKTQWVGNERDEMARRFGIPADDVRVINPFVGGAFGSALRTWPHVTLAALAARRVGKPVRLELTRRQLSTAIGYRPATRQRVMLGAERDGTLTALVQEVVSQTSTYEEFAEPVLAPASTTYVCPNRRTRYDLVAMHASTPCPMRGPGWATGLIGLEMAMDELAETLGLDPIALRLRNHADRHPMSDLPWSSKRLRACYTQGAERFGWARRNPLPRSMRSGRNLVGYGMATAVYHSARYQTSASAAVRPDGTVLVSSATTDMGPGTYTSATQVAADTLGVPLERIVFELGDSSMPAAKEHGGSTTLASVGSAVQAACLALRAKLDALAAAHPQANDTAVLLRLAGRRELRAEASSAPGQDAKRFATVGFGAVFAEVHVDPDLCLIHVARVIGAYDAGRIVNPRLAHSQAIGGMVGGIGMAIFEEAEWDEQLGRVTNATLAEYLMPVNADIGELAAIFVDSTEPVMNPLGVKGCAELGLCGVAPAIANAVWHATGRRVRDLPVTAAKLLS